MPSFAAATLEIRSSLAFCAISMSEGIDCSFCCGTASCLILWARHYKGGAIARTLTEVKTQIEGAGGQRLRPSEGGRNYAFDASFSSASARPPPKLECTGVGPPWVTFTAQYLNSGILPNG